jgi:hypothetical protein
MYRFRIGQFTHFCIIFLIFFIETSFHFKSFAKKLKMGPKVNAFILLFKKKKNIKSFPCEQDTISMGTGGEDT